MEKVNTTNLRQNLPGYLKRVRAGEAFQVMSHGKVIARLIPEQDRSKQAKAKLEQLRKTAITGDLISPLHEDWEADNGGL